ncbi:MAG: hypothetical protein ACTSVY_12185, partial [Candidatus Helarchaeota archaeon]
MSEENYEILARKLDSAMQGLSPLESPGEISDTWMEYLKVLIPLDDIKYLIEFPVFPSTITLRKFAKKIKKSQEDAEKILDRLFKNNVLMSIGSTTKRYGIQLPMGIFDFPPLSYHEYPPKKAKLLAELSYKYLVDEKWYKN